jgi:DNA-binding GntR family transcriptional regulator
VTSRDQSGKPKSSAQRAVAELRRLIFEGELAAGSNHLESELADRLDMSRTPVREAVLMLDGQGLLEVRPRKGVRILPVSAADMREIYEVLTELESLAAENAAKAEYSMEELAILTETIAAMDSALAREDRDAWAEADDRFHVELVRLGGNARIQSIVAMMADQVRRARAITLHLRPLPLTSNEDHRGVLNAIRQGDSAAARRIHHAHRSHARGVITGLLEGLRLHHL